MALRQRSIRTVGELLETLPTVFGRSRKTVWFRGHSSADWELLPSLARRPDRSTEEMVLFKRFKQHAFPYLERVPEYEWEWLFLMQHYAVATRLLDWTESPLVGLYFALLKAPKRGDKRKAAALWCLYPTQLNAISNVVLNPPHDIPCFG